MLLNAEKNEICSVFYATTCFIFIFGFFFVFSLHIYDLKRKCSSLDFSLGRYDSVDR